MGLYFQILAVNSDEVHRRAGRVRRIVGIDPRWFNHPSAIRIPEDEFRNFLKDFRDSSAQFNYYGHTEYTGEALTTLLDALHRRISSPAALRWGIQTVEFAKRILNEGAAAIRKGQTLLVLGI